MKHEPNLISIQRTSALRLDPSLTGEEAIALRALAAGESARQVCRELDMDPATFVRMMRDMPEKIGMADNVSLIEWARKEIKGVDQRVGGRERYGRLA